ITAAVTNGGIVKNGRGAVQFSGPLSFLSSITVNEGMMQIVGSQTFSFCPINLMGGVLSVTANNSLGDASNSLTFAGGTLLLDGSFTTARAFNTTTAGGGLEITGANVITASTGIKGSGTFA